MSIRSAAKALIVHEGKLLLNRCVHADGSVYYDLPGGGQQQYESLEDAVVREVREETGYTVRVVRFAALAEEIYTSEKLRAAFPDYTHRVKHIFAAELTERPQAAPTELDMCMECCEWVAVEKVRGLQEVHPAALKECLLDVFKGSTPMWLGTEYVHDEQA